ncbi:MAG: tetratricopeptide repeat protein, partial [Gammaproteobacteria bacterium]|nr:tetratricopeptide repeat protein [Gammaproteobacteria bacterium]
MKNIKVFHLILLCLSLISLLSCDAWDKTAEQYLESSQSYYDRGEISASLIEVKNALQKNPMNPEIHLFAAKIYLKLRQGKDAEIQLAKAVSLGIDQSKSLPLLSHALFQQRRYQELLDVQIPQNLQPKDLATVYAYQGFAAAESQKPELADTLYKQSITQQPDNRLALRGTALLQSAAGEYDKAINLIQQLIEKQPSDVELRSLLGDLFVGSRQFDQAVASYTKAIELEKDKQFPYFAKRAIACISKSDLDCAVDDLSVLQKQAKNYYMTDYVKGLLAIKQQRWKDAESALSGALLSNAELTPAYYFSGLSHFQQKQYDLAINQLAVYVAREPESNNGRHLLSLSQLKAGHLESARSTLLPLIKSGYIESTILYLLGQIEYQLGNISDSIRYFKTLSERHPESAVAHTQLGLKLLSKGEVTAGQGELAIAIDIKPDLMEAGQASVLAFLESRQ